ncbi:MAG: alanine dehydrogenase [Candidatus Omnitrophica bacterium CG11_big_fil_rev_8_21_14_0_20_45_26]|uniref:Putative alanine dehydrogenase n=1 Tax=Candidatus Abzuiibacterium crystallinum TaxID=1974748 RepID=A0A2H0LL75_9BACT|nr:MAG: alanine dehydrogenase [Candidatus Omnitrophica bacterium CG11_big_fil_rev_8_21_14_0_20_45_26]PIW63772.1 MAG: alanine dehydrogenase [Candidatus Omnitrophica bacterium CG12_big_fil_rev_8_21_14_0_65_45_16]
MAKRETLLLTQKDIQQLFTMRDCLRVVEGTFRSHGRGYVQMPAKSYLYIPQYQGDFRSMPAFVEDLGAAGIKWVNVHPNNPQKGLPTVMAMIILGDVKTGFPLCVMDGTHLTNLRTGAAGAVAAKYLARKNSKTVALIGSGRQAVTQLEALRLLFKIKQVSVWSKDRSSDERFMRHFKGALFQVRRASHPAACVKGADIVTTITPSRRPIIQYKWLSPGTHINAIGADAKGKEEIMPQVLKRAKVVIDDWEQASHSGEINVPFSRGQLTRRDIHATLGEVITQQKKGRSNSREITVFDSTGLSIQDIACAHTVYRLALKQGKGTFKRFF